LDRAVGDHDPRSFRRAGLRRPHVARDRGAVACGEQDRVDDSVAVRRPVVQADVAGASVRAVPAQIVGEESTRIGGLGGQGLSGAGGAVGRELGLVLRGVVIVWRCWVIEKFCASTTELNVVGGFAAAGATWTATTANITATPAVERLPAIAPESFPALLRADP
jgi:hypothetical protein